MKRHIVTVITSVTKQRVIIGEAELLHAIRHFLLPQDILLELIERVLKDPTDVFVDSTKAPRIYELFYRLEDGRYLLAVVKVTQEGAFFASMYPTGFKIRSKHRKMKRVKL